MPAPRKYDEETRTRAVRMYHDRVANSGESMIEARRQVGALLDIHPSTLAQLDRTRRHRPRRPGGITIAPSTHHAAKTTPVSARDLADAYLTNALVNVYNANRRVYGVRKLWRALHRAGTTSPRRGCPA